MLYLKAFDKEDNLISIGGEAVNGVGRIFIKNLEPSTLYELGDFYVRWIGDKFESGKIPLPSFVTLEKSTNKEFVFYWNDALVVKTKTAYDIAVDNGFEGTEDEWVESIKGEPGSNGLNAYQLALENGFSGTQEEWLKTLKGEPGEDGKSFTPDDLDENDYKKILEYGLQKGYLSLDKLSEASKIQVGKEEPEDKTKIWIDTNGGQ